MSFGVHKVGICAVPARLADLMDDLSEIEGAAGNLRGVFLEMITAYLARIDAVSVDVGITALDDNARWLILTCCRFDAKQVASGLNVREIHGGIVSVEEVED